MLALILDGRTAIDGARQGIELCLRTVIPSLFPFFVLSILLTSSLLGSSLIVLRPLGRLFGMPEGAEPLGGGACGPAPGAPGKKFAGKGNLRLTFPRLLAIIIKQSFLGHRFAAVLELVDRPA